ncbi:MAG: DUF6782 family putative metallopeptidase [Pseudomonadota bacterium]
MDSTVVNPITSVTPGQNCRVAYTLNNRQPVICSLVGDQPLFYLDEETAMEDDALLDLPKLDGGPAALMQFQNKLQAYETFSRSFAVTSEDKENLFRDNARLMTGDNLADALAGLRHSRLAASYLDACAAHNITFQADATIRTACFDRQGATIRVNANLAANILKLAIIRELRRAWLTTQGAGIDPLQFHPDHAIIMNRVEAADLAVTQVRIAWELQLAGQRNVWGLIENSTLADLGRAFGREACMDFRSLSNGDAAVAAFETWFLSERCRRHDRRLIQMMLSSYQHMVKDASPHLSRLVGAELVACIGTQPYGKNYLAPYTQLIMNDTVFTEVRDRSNANFLWFIKFERAVTQAEDEQKPEVVAGATTLSEMGVLVSLFPQAAPADIAAKRRNPAE